jgi:hypothetical protein
MKQHENLIVLSFNQIAYESGIWRNFITLAIFDI